MSLPTVHMEATLVQAPELRFTPSGRAVATLRVVASSRKKDADGVWQDDKATFLDVVTWSQLAQHVADSLDKGDKVRISGRLEQRSYEAKDGTKRTVYEVVADDVALSLSRNPAKAVRSQRAGAGAAEQTDVWSEPGF